MGCEFPPDDLPADHPPAPDPTHVRTHQKAMVGSGFRPDSLSLLSAPALACTVCGGAGLRRPCDAECGGTCRYAALACPVAALCRTVHPEAGGSLHQAEAGIRYDPDGVLHIRLRDCRLYGHSIQRQPCGGGIHALCLLWGLSGLSTLLCGRGGEAGSAPAA